jgi:hypothetical protein
MATYPPRRRHVPGSRVGVFLFAFCSLRAQDLMISAGSHVAQSCGPSLAAAAVQRDVEAQLGLENFRVTKAHTASLESEIDCVAVNPRAPTTRLAVHQCLALSQVVTLPAQVRGAFPIRTPHLRFIVWAPVLSLDTDSLTWIASHAPRSDKTFAPLMRPDEERPCARGTSA